MTVSLALLIPMAVLYACGVYLLLEKSMTRVILGFLLIGNATNILLLITAGRPGSAPITDGGSEEPYSDPLPQALILTAIVITFAVSAFLMALVYRSWKLAREDQLEPDAEDLAISTRAGARAETPEGADEDTDFQSDDPLDSSDLDPVLQGAGRQDEGRSATESAAQADADASAESGAEGPKP
ncbi:Na(+)/H(+) antiporter subunit C [Naasia lichenicola]|uniref:Na(+)/H(+) antiporter subunit C n=1 Tax=Naasia lichenicola TaxID=2565933 RepID=A0A4S4FQE6_9MICO|nr:Na(+)/H(+) antiporter subunit C [Naasia lichenicola]THG31835.1 Na(+)/H(+) antiporter subunit C [Naasia lichenicola]